MILITSLDKFAYPPQTLVWLYRVRWQIELAFKRLKSILRLGRLPAKNPELARARIAADLLLALLIEDATAETAAFPLPDPETTLDAPTAVPAHALWRRACILPDAIKALIWPPLTLTQIAKIRAQKCRQLFEPPRRRKLQTIPYAQLRARSEKIESEFAA